MQNQNTVLVLQHIVCEQMHKSEFHVPVSDAVLAFLWTQDTQLDGQ